MDISIILCTANRSETLSKTLKVLSKVDVPQNMFCTLIVVDNTRSTDTEQVLRSVELDNMALEYVQEPRQGKCFALNAGIAMSRGDILLFLDDDVHPPASWLKGMCKLISEGKASAVVGGVRIAPHLERSWMTRLQRSLMGSTENHDVKRPLIIGGNLAVCRTVFEKIPAFDTELGPGMLGCYEDVLFSEQVYRAGFRVGSAFDTVAEHHFDISRLTRLNFLEYAKKKGRSLAYLRYHWLHKTMEFPERRLIRTHLSLGKARLLRFKEWRRREGISDWELTLVSHTHLYEQFIKERRRPRNYEQFGLVKLT